MIRLSVPATSANLGPGFDCLGLAVNLYLEVEASLSKEDRFYYRGEGSLPDHPDNLIHQGFSAAFAHLGESAPAVSFKVNNPIPLARGLGSSSAALVAGIAAADSLVNGALGREGVFALSAGIEGHPDNVAPAIFGGFTLSAKTDGGFVSRSLELPHSWQFLFGVPDFELLTREARAVLPEHYARADLIHTASRTALWSLAVTQNQPELLRVATKDRVHEPYRAPLIPGLSETKERLYEAGAFAAYLSGAGPTIGVICSAAAQERCTAVLSAFVGEKGRVLELAAGQGYRVEVTTPG